MDILYYSNNTIKGTFIKGINRKLLETLVLFFILFFPKNAPGFLSIDEISYSFFWRLPAVVLIILLLESPILFRPKRDLIVFAAALPALFLTGFLVSLAAAVTGFLPPEKIRPPGGIQGWTAAILLSLSIGALEEAFFRVYLPERIMGLQQAESAKAGKKTSRSAAPAFIVSAFIFALCHAWEGPWGIANALLASFVLSIAYIKSGSFPGIALAHGLYNIFVFLSVSLIY